MDDQVSMLRRELFGADAHKRPATALRQVAKVAARAAAKTAGARAVLLRESSTASERTDAFKALALVALALLELAVSLAPPTSSQPSAHAKDRSTLS